MQASEPALNENRIDVSGRVAAHRTDATAEPGNMLVSVLYNRTPPDGIDHEHCRDERDDRECSDC
jgi:hypothetical protein